MPHESLLRADRPSAVPADAFAEATTPAPHLERRGLVLAPDGGPLEAEGVLNPGSARDREGRLLLYPRMVAAGNVSRVGLVAVDEVGETRPCRRLGTALAPETPYERRAQAGGYGCEDPRVTFVAALDRYVMAYAAYGPTGPRIALALSRDAYVWERLGPVVFAPGLPDGADKDAVFFPEPVLSPAGVESLAFYHRPMHLTAPPVSPAEALDRILALPPEAREGIRIAYVPLAAVHDDLGALLRVAESAYVVAPHPAWGAVKIGAGTPPVAAAGGWLSLYHGVDVEREPDGATRTRYTVGALLHDRLRPHLVRYRSPEPLLRPETADERSGTVDDVVFPTAIEAAPTSDGDATGPDRASDAAAWDVYYGMADARIGRLRLTLDAED